MLLCFPILIMLIVHIRDSCKAENSNTKIHNPYLSMCFLALIFIFFQQVRSCWVLLFPTFPLELYFSVISFHTFIFETTDIASVLFYSISTCSPTKLARKHFSSSVNTFRVMVAAIFAQWWPGPVLSLFDQFYQIGPRTLRGPRPLNLLCILY